MNELEGVEPKIKSQVRWFYCPKCDKEHPMIGLSITWNHSIVDISRSYCHQCIINLLDNNCGQLEDRGLRDE